VGVIDYATPTTRLVLHRRRTAIAIYDMPVLTGHDGGTMDHILRPSKRTRPLARASC